MSRTSARPLGPVFSVIAIFSLVACPLPLPHPPRTANTTGSAGPNDEGTAIEEDARMARRMKFWYPFRGALPGRPPGCPGGGSISLGDVANVASLRRPRRSPWTRGGAGQRGHRSVRPAHGRRHGAASLSDRRLAWMPSPNPLTSRGTAMKRRLLYFSTEPACSVIRDENNRPIGYLEQRDGRTFLRYVNHKLLGYVDKRGHSTRTASSCSTARSPSYCSS